MKISTERTDDCQLRLTVEVDPERVEQYLQRAARRLAKKVHIPGFRKGKVPYGMLVNVLGKEALYEEALEEMGQDVYKEALDAQGITPYAQGRLEDFSTEPMVLNYTVPLEPEVELNDYRSIRVESEKVEVSAEEVAEALRQLQEERADWVTVDRPVAEGDMAVAHTRVSMDGETLDDDEHSFIVNLQSEYPIPGFYEALLGMTAGETKEFALTYPDDWPNETNAGKTVEFEVNLKEVKEKSLPELNDEFAALVGAYDSLEDLRDKLHSDLLHQKEHAALHRLEDSAMEQAIERATINYPPVVLEQQMDEMLREQDQIMRRQQGVGLQDYLKMTGQTEQDLQASLRGPAETRIKRSLILTALAEREKLTADEEEMQEQQQRLLSAFSDDPAVAQSFLATAQGRDIIRRDILNRKALERLIAIAKGEAPELDTGDGSEPSPAGEESQATLREESVTETADTSGAESS